MKRLAGRLLLTVASLIGGIILVVLVSVLTLIRVFPPGLEIGDLWIVVIVPSTAALIALIAKPRGVLLFAYGALGAAIFEIVFLQDTNVQMAAMYPEAHGFLPFIVQSDLAFLLATGIFLASVGWACQCFSAMAREYYANRAAKRPERSIAD
jgi:hypothetical protein